MNRGWLTPAQFAAFGRADTNAHRIFSDDDGWIERLAQDALISHKSAGALDAMRAGLAEWASANGWQPRRVFGKLLPRQNEDRDPPVLLEGDSTLPLTGEVRESGVRYGLDFAAGYSAGLFLDQRMNRAFLQSVAPKRLLNTFAYTCSFSVVSALAGAETVSIDLSKKSVERGRANFSLNGLDPNAGHKFVADDVLDVLPRLARRGEKFDAIVLDPPTFSRGNKGRRWQVGQHLEDLVIAGMEVAAPSARILISTNCAKIQNGDLERVARFALKFHRRPGDLHREAQPADFPPGHGARTLWVSLRG
ncbi:MAG: class I SAM-dependent methyltransferase [Chthoniobacteraceae bacterium]